jgi:FtsH-binding integral membrane protein
MEYDRVSAVDPSQVEVENRAFLVSVYRWMTLGLAATAGTALAVASSPTALGIIFGNPFVFYGLVIAELAMVWSFSTLARRVSARTAAGLFFLYAVTNGVTLSFIFIAYTRGSIAATFFVTAGTFGAMSAYGALTKSDLSSWSSFLLMGLFGVLLASVVNVFLGSPMLYWAITYAAVLTFVGLAAYDTQRIKQMNVIGNEGTEEDTKESLHGALILYLDFINLFLYLLRILGRRR